MQPHTSHTGRSISRPFFVPWANPTHTAVLHYEPYKTAGKQEAQAVMGMRLLGGRQVRWAALAQLGALLGCLVLSTLVYRYFEVCDRETGGALAEFPAFGNADIDPGPDDGDDCYAPFTAKAPTDSVIGYYRRQLISHGWQIRTVAPEDLTMSSEPELHMLAGERRNVC